MSALVEVKDICKIYNPGENEVRALDHVSLSIETGEFVAIIGQSGSGKSTLMNLLGCLDTPTSGTYYLNGQDVSTLTDDEQSDIRNKEIGFIFQGFNLISNLTARENVELPLIYRGVPKKERERLSEESLKIVGLAHRMDHKPNEMSGGQQQRVAIARALATHPKVLLCDEATSALDPNTTRQILELIRDINQKLNITVVVITHQMSVVKEICSHVAILDEGRVAESGLVGTVFAAPKSAAGRRLVFPGGADAQVYDPSEEKLVRLVFKDSKTTSIPLIARLAAEENIFCNVISASTQKLSEEVYGSMMLGIPSSQFDKAVSFIRNVANVEVEEVE